VTDDRAARARSFGSVAEDYDRYRPGPPAAVLDWLLPEGAATVVDVGAGTGALTRILVDRVAAVTAVEPDPEMRRVLADRVPAATILEGSAEALPIADATADAVLGASMWHWVDPPRAAAEAARVLRPGGVLGVLWTHLDPESEEIGWLWPVLRDDRPPVAARDRASRALDLGGSTAFAEPEGPNEVAFSRRFTRDDLVGLAGTYSETIVGGPQEREARLAEVRRRLEADARVGAHGIDVPMRSWCWRAVRD
jgi:SAM-dependent methyltransferase